MRTHAPEATINQTLMVGLSTVRVAVRLPARVYGPEAHARRSEPVITLVVTTAHGLRRTNADKRRAVETLLRDDEWRRWSDRAIAEKCGVSPDFASRMRRGLSSDDSRPDADPPKRISADGRERPATQPKRETKIAPVVAEVIDEGEPLDAARACVLPSPSRLDAASEEPMKKLLVPTLCVLAGCAAGAMIPAVTAQWPDNPQAQRWQAECVDTGRIDRHEMERMNSILRDRVQQGWEPWQVYSLEGSGGQFLNAVCFKRPAP